MLAVLCIGVLVAAFNLWWTSGFRDLGALTVDDAAYMSASLRLHRVLDPLHPGELVREFLRPSATAPLVPALSVPVLVVGSRSVTTALAVQSLIGVVAACGATGLARRLGGPRAALVAGLVVLALPGMVGSARAYQYAAALGACMLLALWALLASDRGHDRRRMIAFGVALGAMLLARTMAVGFLPGMVAAAAVHVRRDRRGLTNLGLAAAVAAIVAGPWWWASRHEVGEYLFSHGYGDAATEFGDSSPLVRAVGRATTVLGDIRLPFLLLAVVTVGCLLLRARRPEGQRPAPEDGAELRRNMVVLALPVVIGAAALMSTANMGVLFELPLELVAVVIVASAGALGGARTARLGPVVVAIAGLTLVVSLSDPGGQYDLSSPRGFVQAMFYGGLDERQPDVGATDARLRSNDRDTRRAAAEEWWTATTEVVDAVEELRERGGPVIETLSGSSQLMNGQTLQLARELRSLHPLDTEEPNSSAPDDDLERYLEPFVGDRRRILVVMVPASERFPKDRGSDQLERLALASEWRPAKVTHLPDGGYVVVLDHPSHQR